MQTCFFMADGYSAVMAMAIVHWGEGGRGAAAPLTKWSWPLTPPPQTLEHDGAMIYWLRCAQVDVRSSADMLY
jgi:hypothetical protein